MMPTAAVIGAGIAGATAARALANAGFRVRLFEKARGPGGRMASRRTSRQSAAPSFDHGCQMLSADASLEPSEPWTHRLATISGTAVDSINQRTRPVPTPRMNAPAAARLEGIDASYATRITRIGRVGTAVTLATDDTELGGFSALVITAPAPQTRDLIHAAAPTIAAHAAAATYDPCWTVMLERPAEAEPVAFDAAEITNHPVAWLCRDSAKPQRDPAGPQRWVAQFAPDFSRNTIDQDPESIAPTLLAAAREHLGNTAELAQKPHRWRYAFVTQAVGETHLAEDPIVAAGDWLLGPRAHHAARSGLAAANAVIAHHR